MEGGRINAGRTHIVRRSKKEVGLRIEDLSSFGEALISKWWSYLAQFDPDVITQHLQMFAKCSYSEYIVVTYNLVQCYSLIISTAHSTE